MDFFKYLSISFIFLVSVSGCRKDGEKPPIIRITPVDSPQLPSRGFFMGILPVPGDNQNFEQAYYQAAQYSEFVPVWGKPSPFYQLPDDLAGSWGQTFLEGYIRGNNMFPIIHLSFFGEGVILITPPGMDNATLSDPEWKNAYKRAAIDAIKIAKPLYISLGNEVNRWYEKYGAQDGDPNGFQHFVALYEEIYDSLKKICPEIIVFCTFAREIVSENRESDLSVITMFNPDKLDLLVFTSYPYAVQGINIPSDIPDNYYSRIFNYITDKPFGFSELGWPSMSAFGGEQRQADFITDAAVRLTRNQGIALYIFGWAWLHDVDTNDYIGLIKRDGTEKLGYQVWKNLSTSGK